MSTEQRVVFIKYGLEESAPVSAESDDRLLPLLSVPDELIRGAVFFLDAL